DVIATNSGWSTAVDFGVYNWNNPQNPGILNYCWQLAEGQTSGPLRYFQGALQIQLYNLVQVNNPNNDLDGTYGMDVSGELIGYWVKEGAGTPLDMSQGIMF